MGRIGPGFEGVLPSVIGGAFGAVAVVIGAVVNQSTANRARKRIEEEQATLNLVVQVSNLRDAATRSRKARKGGWDLWPLRTQLFMSQQVLGATKGHRAAWEFLDAAERLRSSFRQLSAAQRDDQASPLDENIRDYQQALDSFADEVIASLVGARELGPPIKDPDSWPPLD